MLEKKVEEGEEVEAAGNSSLQNSRAPSENDLSQSGISDTESEGGNVSDGGYTSGNDPTETANINMVNTFFLTLRQPGGTVVHVLSTVVSAYTEKFRKITQNKILSITGRFSL